MQAVGHGQTGDAIIAIGTGNQCGCRLAMAGLPQHNDLPPGWVEAPGLLFGFGGRGDAPPAGTVQVRQVHGVHLVSAQIADFEFAVASGVVPNQQQLAAAVAADAIEVIKPNSFAGIRTADCVPVLMYVVDENRRPVWAAAVHAGWRGTLAGVVDTAVKRGELHGVGPGSVHALLGPSIGPCCYEVSEEVAGQFRSVGYPVIAKVTGNPHLDLRDINRQRLLECGVGTDQIALVGPCTRCNPERYHSYRYDCSDDGRQVSWIGWT